MKNYSEARQGNKSVIYDEELSILTGEELVLDFVKISNEAYAIGVPFKNIQLQNLGDGTGANVENLIIYYNQATKQSQKVRKNFVFEKPDQEIRSLRIKNLGTGTATFDLRLDNKDTELSLLTDIRDKLYKSKEDKSGNVRA